MAFTAFPSLPTELRWKIWEAHCPELGQRPQILHIEFDPNKDEARSGEHLWRQTAPIRDVLSLCRDSREYALRVLPNTIALRKGQGIVRYVASRDVIRLDPEFATPEYVHEWRPVTGFSDQVVNLTFNLARLPWVAMSASHIFRLCLSFPRLRYVFPITWGLSQRPRDLAWCVSRRAYRTSLVLIEPGGDNGTGLEVVYSWPDVSRHEEWAGAVIPRGQLPLNRRARSFAANGMRGHVPVNCRGLEAVLEYTRDTLEGMELVGTEFSGEELAHLRGIWVWPMVSLPADMMEKMGDVIRESGVEALPPGFPQ